MAPADRSTVRAVVLLLVAAASSVTLAAKIPESWGTCKRSDPQLDSCVAAAMQRAIPDLKEGNKRFGVFPMDPFKFEKVHLEQGGTGSLRINMTFTDCDITGLGDSKIESFKSDLDHYKISSVLRTPFMTLRSKYSVVGQVLVIPINGNGKCTIAMKNVRIGLDMLGSPYTGKNGKKHMKIDSMTFNVEPEKTTFEFVNPEHAQQASLLSRVVTENDKVIMQDLQPAISEAFSLGIKEAATRIFAKVPFDEVFPQ